MIAAFLFPYPVRGVQAPYLWFYYRLLSSFSEPMYFIGSRSYTRPADEWISESRWEVSQGSRDHLGYTLPSQALMERHLYFYIDDELFCKFLSVEGGNPTAVFRRMLCERIPELEDIFDSALANVEDIEAILTLCNCPSLSAVAKKYGIPVIHVELGPLRPPLYHATAYLDFQGVNGSTETEARYQKTQWSPPSSLTTSLLRSLFQCVQEKEIDDAARIPLGVVLQIDDDSNLVAFGNGYSNQDLITYAVLKKGRQDILVRPHPGSAFSMRVGHYTVDTSPDTIAFIKRCDRVLTINSSVGLEAILHDVPVTVLGDSSYRFIATATNENELVDRLAFYLLAYLVPMDSLFDPAYLRFRLSAKDDRDIVIRHLTTYAENANKMAAKQDVQLASLHQSMNEHESRIEGLRETLDKQDMQLAILHQSMHERDSQIASLNQTVAWRDAEIADHTIRALEISHWATAIEANPIRYGLKKMMLTVARGTLRALPGSIATKCRLRDVFYSASRSMRRVIGSMGRQSHPRKEAELHAVQIRPAGDERDVFIFAVIDWHFRIQRPQHIARSLAEEGHRVFYVSNHFIDADEPGYKLERLPGADTLYQLKLHVRGAPAIYFEPPSDEVLAMMESSMARVVRDFGALSSLSILQHAYWYPLAARLPNSYRIYDCMDHHEGFGNVPEKLVVMEKEMLRSVDLVTVTSTWLEDFARQYNQSVAVIRNAAQYTHFMTQPELIYVDGKSRRIIGYYGAIAEWFDSDLVRAVAEAYPEYLILLVGEDTVGACDVLADLNNVKFTGEVPYTKLPYYLYAFDVCLLPFKVNSLTLATNPVKVYEYLAAGKSVVCVDLPEISQFGDRVGCAGSTEEFVALVGVALREGGEANSRATERRRFAAEQTWRHRGRELAAAIEAVRMPRVSVIILTFNNLDLTRACIDSVLGKSEYPNLEIIIVDNASSDGTPACLKEYALLHPNIQVVLNSQNLGFAAGNNIGISVATGDYLVILNNDTVVTQGWVMTMLRHFQALPSLGLLNPVTNNIGNEARIEIDCLHVDNMDIASMRYTLAHMGQRYPMSNAAFFCVMMPRSTYERCGPISEDYGRGFFEDDDYCRKVEAAGLAIACAEDTFVYHHLSASFDKVKDSERQALFEKNKIIYEQKWGAWIPHSYRRNPSSRCL